MMPVTVTEEVRCPYCKSPCQLLRENVYYFNRQRGYTLYQCSDIDCAKRPYVLKSGHNAIMFGNSALTDLVELNIKYESIRIKENQDILRSRREKLQAQEREVSEKIKQLERELDAIASSWQKLS